jgi:hypothetical protein
MSPLSVPPVFIPGNLSQTQRVLFKQSLIPGRFSLVLGDFQTFSQWQITRPKQSILFSTRISFPLSPITSLLETALEQTVAFSTLLAGAYRTYPQMARLLTFF